MDYNNYDSDEDGESEHVNIESDEDEEDEDNGEDEEQEDNMSMMNKIKVVANTRAEVNLEGAMTAVLENEDIDDDNEEIGEDKGTDWLRWQ